MLKPAFYDPNKIGQLYLPRFGEVEAEADKLNILSSSSDPIGHRIALMIIDMQVDFCHTNGTLCVPGALGDIGRLIDFILANMDKLTSIFASLDSHLLFQIFYRSWWRLQDGTKPGVFTEIYKDKKPTPSHGLMKSINDGDISPMLDPIKSMDYAETLLKQANKPLCVWPYHTELGTPGQALDPALYEILAYHSFARKSQLNFLQKGQIPQTEMYGILSPEVKIPKHPQGGFNTDFLNILMKHDKVVIAGQASSHCVLETIRQIYNFFITTDKDVLKKVYVLEDCMSPVVHPAIDFAAIVQTEFDKFRKSGINIVKSTDPILA